MLGREKWFCEPRFFKRWAEFLFGEMHVPQRLRSYWILREIRRLGLMDRPVHMLDAGCGRGELAVHLAKRCPHWRITGIDIDEDRLSICRRVQQRAGLGNIEFHNRSLLEIGAARQFDLIVNADVLPALENDVDALRGFCRALRPGGFVIIASPSVPQRKHLRAVKWRERRIGFSRDEYGYVRDGYGPEDFRWKFREAGGEMLHSRFTFGWSGTLMFDLFFICGDSKPNPVLYLLLFPVLMLLAGLDLLFPPRSGSAILAVATPVPQPARPVSPLQTTETRS